MKIVGVIFAFTLFAGLNALPRDETDIVEDIKGLIDKIWSYIPEEMSVKDLDFIFPSNLLFGLWPGSNYLEDLWGDVPLATVRPFEGCGCNMMVLHLTMPFRGVRFIFIVSPFHRKIAGRGIDLLLTPFIEKTKSVGFIFIVSPSIKKIAGRDIDLLLTPFIENTKRVGFIFIVSPFHRKIAGRGIDLLLTPFIEKTKSVGFIFIVSPFHRKIAGRGDHLISPNYLPPGFKNLDIKTLTYDKSTNRLEYDSDLKDFKIKGYAVIDTIDGKPKKITDFSILLTLGETDFDIKGLFNDDKLSQQLSETLSKHGAEFFDKITPIVAPIF
ncbi:hypothetical protein NQ317_018534 [Molorchus minor]|uniref:Uncharacterized protein n=1 Tax=Molorchus minor TaxID=1323400 RepID=A0ABQ9JXC0_9CUCU|nr:hypothetical protein NQ317_018534 [Molorchus minor]